MDPGFSVPESETEQEADKLTTVTEATAVQPEIMTPEPEVKESESADTRSSARKVQADLIDKFISANPRIEPKRETPDHPVEDLAEQFTEEKGSFITETLARIYINQGYYSKAIEIYEKLCLKFPEKSSYFATQIEKIKEIIN
jgi:tetratricopeptide (TPR) repeat protein